MVSLAGSVIGLQMDKDQAQHTVERIKEHLIRGDYHLNQARKLILDLREYCGWKALGYTSWRQCVMQEFEKSSSTVYRQLDAALVELQLSPNGGIGQINERVLRPLAKRNYDAEARQAIWSIAQDAVGEGGRITTGVIEAVVSSVKDILQSGAAQDGDGEQHVFTELLRADVLARVREVKLAHKQHVQRMDSKRTYLAGGVQSSIVRTNEYVKTARVDLFHLSDIQLAAIEEAKRLGKPIYCSLWTEE